MFCFGSKGKLIPSFPKSFQTDRIRDGVTDIVGQVFEEEGWGLWGKVMVLLGLSFLDGKSCGVIRVDSCSSFPVLLF